MYSNLKIMKQIFLIISFFLVSFLSIAQTKITGKITDNKGKAIAGVSITIKDTYDGGTSDSLGKYSFNSFEKGEQIILVTCIGYTATEQKIQLNEKSITLNFSIKEEVNELKAVVINAGSFEASDRKRAVAVLNPIDIVTTASANADITNAIKTLPGAQQVGETEGLFVRGGTAQETRVFIDGSTVNNFFFSSVPDIAQRGRFSPFIFKGTVFSSGGYSAIYGQALSGALILESIDLPERSEASIGISSVGLNGGFQHLAKNKKSSWGGSLSYTNLLPYFKIVKQKPDYWQEPDFKNAEFNFRIKTKNGGMIKYYTYFNLNKLGIRNPDIDSSLLKNAFGLENFNWYNNVSWRENLGKGWKLNAAFSYSSNKDDIFSELQDASNKSLRPSSFPYNSKYFNVNVTGNLTQLRAVFEKKLSGISSLRIGSEFWSSNDESNFSNQFVSNFKNKVTDNYVAAFAETDLYLTNALAFKAGTRFENSSLLNKTNIAPRISLAYKTGKQGQVSLAYGTFYQKPSGNILMFKSNLDYSRATHYIANYQIANRFQTLRVEGFYKKYNSLVKTFPDTSNTGFGEATGFELFWRDRKTFKNLDYWVSYSYLNTTRDFNNFPSAMTPNFAAKHTLNIVMKKFVLPWKTGFNATYTLATPRPYYNLKYNSISNKIEIQDQGNTPTYHNISFSLNYLPNIGKQNAKTSIVYVASITNIFGFNQVFNYNYNYTGSIKQAITPPAKRFIFIGCFISIGTDRTQDAINNNL